jgi:hypothetical protein
MKRLTTLLTAELLTALLGSAVIALYIIGCIIK